MNAQSPTGASAYEAQTEKVTDPARITGLLGRIKNERALLTVTLPGEGGAYNSALLDVHTDRGFIVIDELSPPTGNQKIAKVGRLRVQVRLKGVMIGFETLLESTGTQDGVVYYNLTLPKSLSYHQQRAHYRARVSAAKSIPVQITRGNGQQMTGELNDISVGGVGLRFKKALPEDLLLGEHIPACRFHLPGGDEITCHLEIRFISMGVSSSTRVVGARFLDLSPLQQSKIAQFVAGLDREMRRKAQTTRG